LVKKELFASVLKSNLFMRLLPFLCILVLGCSAPPEKKELDILDTQMAEIRKPLYVKERDTLRLINHWIKLRGLLIANDTSEIKKQSCSYVYCPVYYKDNNYFSREKTVPLFFFLNAPFKKEYLNNFSEKILTIKPKLYYNEDVSEEMLKELHLNDTSLQSYSIDYLTRDTSNNYVISRTHTFNFIVNRQGVKFAGLSVYENGSRYLFKKMKEDSLYFSLKKINQPLEEERNSLDTLTNKWLTLDLINFQEPNLYRSKMDKTDKTYRFTWLRSFHIPVIIRIDKKQNSFSLTCKELIDNEGYSPNEFKLNTTKKISMPQWITFEYLLKKLNFEYVQTDNSNNEDCMDGAVWILEAKSAKNYHCVYRHCTTEKDFKNACLYLLKLSGLNIKKEDIY
jgi:hypothetical protein